MEKFEVNNIVTCINNKKLEGNDYAPPLKVDQDYTIQEIWVDRDGNQHLHVGLTSRVNFVRSYETKEVIPDSRLKWWCHPSRFKLSESQEVTE